MKRLLAALVLVLLGGGVVFAGELIIGEQAKKIPALKQGIAFSLIDNEFDYLSTTKLLEWKDFALEGGYSAKDKIVAVLSYELLKLKDKGASLPVLDLVYLRPGVFVGFGSINKHALNKSEVTYGVSLTLLDIKF